MKAIKYMIWFIKESPKYTGASFWKLLFKENLIKRGVNFTKNCLKSDEMSKKYGTDMAYAIMDRTIEI